MPPFTSESNVRLRFQLNDALLVPADLIAACIGDAHAELERLLDPGVDVDPPEVSLISGETLLACAYLFRALASKDAFAQRNITIGGQRIEDGDRFRALTAVAEISEKQAWFLLAPYLVAQPVRAVAETTPSVPVMGEN